MTDFDDEYDPIFDDLAPHEAAAGTKKNDYEVGYGKPPIHSQYQPGQSGNPKGRPKGTRNFKTDAMAVLAVPVKVNKDGKTKKVSSQHAALLKLREKALKGDARSIERFLELARIFNADDLAIVQSNLSSSDEEILMRYQQRIVATVGATVATEGGTAACVADASSVNSDASEEDDDAWLN